ncbi:hypothetical protein BRC66_04740 [Halobacteriales archaeon QH_2_66_30]|nr:MAG: hypothetical protein BRC66_04740 [Halobacteriales archaeon QH_2_66_30]
MNRRKFLLGSAAALTGSGLLVGTQGSSRVESQRTVRVQVEDDEEAYLGIQYRDVDISCDGRIEITLMNQAKEDFTDIHFDYNLHGDKISLGTPTKPGSLDLGSSAEIEIPASCCSNSTRPEGTLTFNITARGANSEIETEENGREIELDCVGTGCLNSSDTDPCPDSDSILTGIRFIAFCGSDTNLNPTLDTISSNVDGEPVKVYWRTSKPVDEVVLQGGREWYRYEVGGDMDGTVKMASPPADEFAYAGNSQGGDNQVKFSGDSARRCPQSPCDGVKGYKIDYEEGSGFGSGSSTQKTC